MKKLLAAIMTGLLFTLPLAGLAAPDETQMGQMMGKHHMMMQGNGMQGMKGMGKKWRRAAMWHGMEGIGWGWLGLGILHVVVFWGVVILVFAALLRWLGTTSALLVGAGASPAA